MPAALHTLPALSDQAERLIALGVHEIAGLLPSVLRAAADEPHEANMLSAIHPDRAPASALASLLQHGGKRGFVVVDMPDVDDFAPPRSGHYSQLARVSTGCFNSPRCSSADTAS